MINILLAKANLNIYNFPRHGEWKMDENVCFLLSASPCHFSFIERHEYLLTMHLYTNAHLTGPLQQAVDSGLIQIFPLN